MPSSHPWTFQPKKIELIASSNHLISSHKSISPQKNNISLQVTTFWFLRCFHGKNTNTSKIRSTLPDHPFTTKPFLLIPTEKRQKHTQKKKTEICLWWSSAKYLPFLHVIFQVQISRWVADVLHLPYPYVVSLQFFQVKPVLVDWDLQLLPALWDPNLLQVARRIPKVDQDDDVEVRYRVRAIIYGDGDRVVLVIVFWF